MVVECLFFSPCYLYNGEAVSKGWALKIAREWPSQSAFLTKIERQDRKVWTSVLAAAQPQVGFL